MITDLRDTPEAILITQSHMGDRSATAELLRRNAGLIFRDAKKFAIRGLSLDDIVAEAQLGFLKGIARFDPTRGVKLTTYAMYWSKAYVRRYVRTESNVLGSTARRHKKENKIMQRIECTHAPDFDALARDFRTSVERVISLAALIGSSAAANREVQYLPDDRTPEAEAIGRDDSRRARELVWRAMRKLTDRERATVAARIADEPKSLAAIGEGFGVSRERARQIEKRAFKKLQRAFRGMGVERMADL